MKTKSMVVEKIRLIKLNIISYVTVLPRIQLVMLCLVLTNICMAQHSVTGTVIDTEGLPIMSASILAQPCDTSKHYKRVTVTDIYGHFVVKDISIPYKLTIQHMAYQNVQVIDSMSTLNIVMKPREQTLKEVIVKGTQPMVKATEDGGISFVGEQIRRNRPVVTALDMLEELPMVMKTDDNYILLGTTETSILINGKKKMQTQEQLKNFLTATPASMVTSLEVYYNSPSKFGVHGASVNIVITTPRHESLSFRGEAFMSAHKNNNVTLGEGGYFSLSEKNWSVNAGYLEDNMSKKRNRHLSAQHYLGDVVYNVNQHTKTESDSKDRTALLNLAITPDQHLDIAAEYVYQHKAPENDVTYNTTIGENYSEGHTHSVYKSDMHNARFNVSYDDWEIGGEFCHYQEAVSQVMTTNSSSSSKDYHNQKYNGYNLYFNGGAPLWGKYLEFGIDGNIRQTDNSVSEIQCNSHSTQSEFETNAYIGMKFSLGEKGFVNTTLQGEYLYATYRHGDETIKTLWKDFDIYPTFTFTYRFNPMHVLQATLSSTKYYPSYWANADNRTHIDNYTEIEGNPDLISSRKYSLNVNYILKGRYIFGIFGENQKNYFTQLLYLKSDELSAAYKYFNIDKNERMGAMAILPIKWFKYFNAQFTLFEFVMHQSGEIEGLAINRTKISSRFNVNNNFSLFGDRVQLEISGWYQLPVIQGLYNVESMYSTNMKISWLTPIKGLTVSFKFDDITNSYKNKVRTSIQRQNYDFNSNGGSQAIVLTARYTFNGYKSKKENVVTNDRLGF